MENWGHEPWPQKEVNVFSRSFVRGVESSGWCVLGRANSARRRHPVILLLGQLSMVYRPG